MSELALSHDIEDLLVDRNLRHMQVAQAALTPGYCQRAASFLRDVEGTIIIGTGFPVANTFETDGPVGAIALYETLQALGSSPWLACSRPLAATLAERYRVIELNATDQEEARAETRGWLDKLAPRAVISIERPGLARDGRYYNMRGVDISDSCAIFDHFMTLCECPTIGIGDGGNEIGMGKINSAISTLNITPSVTACDELIVADVSNWAAYGLIAFLELWSGQRLLDRVSPRETLAFLSQRGSVDGVTGENTMTEDGLPLAAGEAIIATIARLLQRHRATLT